jgi:hypothetical protein
MTEYDGDTVDFGAKPTRTDESESDGYGQHGPGFMEAPAQVADAKDLKGAARPAIPGVEED